MLGLASACSQLQSLGGSGAQVGAGTATASSSVAGSTAPATIPTRMPNTSLHAHRTEQIDSFVAAYRVERTGVIKVTETIAYDFGSASRHGIYRTFVVRQPDPLHGGDVVYGINHLRVTATGTSSRISQATFSENGVRLLIVKIGDANRVVTGVHTYTISYDLSGALMVVDGRPDLVWNATGYGWQVPIDQARVTVSAYRGVQRAVCIAGKLGTVSLCAAAARLSGGSATYRQGTLPPKSGLTVVASFKPGAIAVHRTVVPR